MSKGYNQQTVAGNLGKDAELVHVGSKETPKASFSVAASTGFGEHEHTEWFNVVVWGKRAEGLAAHLTRGTRVLASGETRTRSWQDDEGKKHYRTEVVITPYNGEIVLLGGGTRSESDSGYEQPPVVEDDEIPF
jgi:single-strand DNA-binding protein